MVECWPANLGQFLMNRKRNFIAETFIISLPRPDMAEMLKKENRKISSHTSSINP